MKPAEIFDVCHSRYSSLRRYLEGAGGRVKSLTFETPSDGYRWRPERSRACEFVADFERIGRNALRRHEWTGRLRLFEIYFLNGIEYRRSIRLVGVAEGTFDYWFQEIKRTLGAEYSRTGLFPPSRYFDRRSGLAERVERKPAHVNVSPQGFLPSPVRDEKPQEWAESARS
jgi:hypothetical protein